jgi:hypothetical protein
MKKIMHNILIGLGALGGLGLLFKGLAIILVKTHKKEDTVPLRGAVEYIKIVPPRYVDPKRVGARIDFTLNLWGTNDTKIKIQNVNVLISSKTSTTTVWERPLWGTNPITKNYVFHKGIAARDGVCAYVDDVKPQDIDVDSLVVEITDIMGKKYLIEKKH